MPTAKYASDTSVPSARSRDEIQTALRRYGADLFAYAEDTGKAAVTFRIKGRMVRFQIPLPDPASPEFTETPSKRWLRSEAEADAAYAKAIRQRWRALALVVKAKLEAIDAGIVSREDAFLAETVMPGTGQTVAETVRGAVDEAIRTGVVPDLGALIGRSYLSLKPGNGEPGA